MGFISAVESFLSKAEKELASWWGTAPKFANVLSTGITIAGAGLETVFTLEGNGSAATLVGDIVSKAQQELLAVKSLTTAVGPNPTAKSILAGVSTDIGTLEQAANITNPKSVAAIKLAISTIDAIVAAYPEATPSTQAA
jgi:hypothetical protein